eukprot:TRINITY_DN65508_c0_g1_i1.p1 TRINITY_DN65508_c0_g1~~TRINITY_DN65508_c0_g1_i1.p1  ORF type:complete len:262 (+),score=43.37 TRINITY_DN65508_c0_g1_i1:87-872(+)
MFSRVRNFESSAVSSSRSANSDKESSSSRTVSSQEVKSSKVLINSNAILPRHRVWGQVEEVSSGTGMDSNDTLVVSQDTLDVTSIYRDIKWIHQDSSRSELDEHSKLGLDPASKEDTDETLRVAEEVFRQCKEQGVDVTLEGVKAMLRMVPYDEDGNPLSLGSISHHDQEAKCKPCLFLATQVGCTKGISCSFCHYSHKRKERSRPCKGKRDRYKKLINRMLKDPSPQSEGAGYSSAEQQQGDQNELAQSPVLKSKSKISL